MCVSQIALTCAYIKPLLQERLKEVALLEV